MNSMHLVLILLTLLAANLPWFSERLFYAVPLKSKHLGWRLLELVIFYFVIDIVAYFVERSSMGQVAPQGWQFYATTGALFIVFAFPGFVWRYLWRK